MTEFVLSDKCQQEMMSLYFDKKQTNYITTAATAAVMKTKKKYEHDILWLVQKKDCRVTKITNKNSIRITENTNDVKWVDKQMHSMLNYAEQKIDIFAWLTKLLDNDRIFRNNMWKVSAADDIFNK